MPLKVGDQVPDVFFRTHDRKEIHLKEFKGKQNVVVAFYPRAFTGGCEREMRKFQVMLPDFKGLDTTILGTSTDAAAPQNAFATHCGLEFPLVADFPEYAAAMAFGAFDAERVQNARVTFVIDKKGVVQAVFKDLPNAEEHVTVALDAIKKLPK